MKHTKGPWSVTNSGGKVQTADMRHPKTICVLETAPLKISPEVEANAQLIAAAPDMLEALNNLVEKVSPYIYKLGVKKAFSELLAIEDAKKAIRKATQDEHLSPYCDPEVNHHQWEG